MAELAQRVQVVEGDSREVLKGMATASIDAVVTDPPYAIGFMGRAWDVADTAFDKAFWREVLRVLKPGGHVIAASATRTYHHLAMAVELGGFEVRDMALWLYGSGFPKSTNVSVAIDKAAGAARQVVGTTARRVGPAGSRKVDGLAGSSTFRESPDNPGNLLTAPATPEAAAWDGWGTALKPACEPWVLARKPFKGTIAATILRHGTGGLNVAACRIDSPDADLSAVQRQAEPSAFQARGGNVQPTYNPAGRFPANVLHDGSDDVVDAFPIAAGESAARFFYSSKADLDDRAGSEHPTVKPVDLMCYLARLITPPGGVILDPFAGSGTTGEAAIREGFRAVLIEREPASVVDIRRRLDVAEGRVSLREAKRARIKPAKARGEDLPLFG